MAGLRLEIRIDDKGSATIKKVEAAHKRLERSVVAGSTRMSRSVDALNRRWMAAKATVGRIALFMKLALVGIGIAAVVTGAKFESSMTNVAAVSGATEAELAKLTATARGLGATTAFTAAQAGDAMMSLAQAGQSVNQIIATTGSVLLFAGAAGTGLKESAEALVQTLAQFTLGVDQADRVVNVFAASMASSLLNAERLREGLSQVGSTAAAIGLSLEATVGVLGQLNNAGMLGGVAGTRLKNVLVRLAAPNTILKRLISETTLATGSFRDKMEELAKSGATAGEVFQAFGRIAGPAVLTLMQQGREESERMEKAVTGTRKAQEMFETQMKATGAQFKIFKSQVQENMIAVFTALQPVLMRTIKGLTSGLAKAKPVIVAVALGAVRLGGAMKRLITENMAAIKLFFGLTAAIGAVVFKAVLLGKAMAIAGAILAAITSPITLVIAGAAALTFVWIKWGDTIKDVAGKVIEDFKFMGRVLVEWARFGWNAIKWPFEKLAELATKAAGVFKKVFPDAAEAIEGMLGVLKEKGGQAIDFIVPIAKTAATSLVGAQTAIINGVVTLVQTTKDKVGGMLKDIKADADKIAGAILLPGAQQPAAPNFDEHVKLWKQAQDKILADSIATGLEAEDARRATLVTTIGTERAHTEAWLAARLELISTNYQEEQDKSAGKAEALAQLAIDNDAEIQEVLREHRDAQIEHFLEGQIIMEGAIAGLGAAWDTYFANLARGEGNWAKMRDASLLAFKRKFITSIAEMIKFWIKQQLLGLLVTRTAQEGAHKASKLEAAKEGAVKAYSAFASIPFVGPILGAAAAAAAFAFLIAFQRGGQVPGTSAGRDTVPSILEPEEFVIQRRSAQAVGPENLDFINRTGTLPPAGGAGDGGDVHLNFNVGGGDPDALGEMTDYLEDEVVPNLEEINSRGRGLRPRGDL